GQIIQTADATDPKHRDNNDNNPTASQNVGSSPASGTTDVGSGSGSGSSITSFGTDTPSAQQLATAQEASTSPSCGQVVSGQVDLSANLNCSGDGIIVDGPNTVINMNGFSITGPGKDTSKVGIMVSNVENVKVNGPGSINNFQAGVLLTGSNGFMINSVILSGNQIGAFMTGAENAQVQQNIVQDNGIGVASHSSTGAAIDSNLMNGNLLAGVTFVNTQQSNIGMNNIVGSQNGVFLDGQSRQNTISSNNVLENVIDLNNANGLPTNINANQYVDNSCETSNPSGLCIGR
ncbi:MAG TPA: right-handed parallel beta-helix repeat-containing protein, partial [Nitrososphaeraceae archaeon]|nr:right-handed parallel beta-helix repeat-containing protein [Nitrososphaeraceae archaeon]